jgi:hypothetical protein
MVLDGFTIMGGHADGDEAIVTNVRGAGIFTYGPIELNNCRFTQNYASLFGGGAYYREATSAGANILNCTFEKNACGHSGGGLIAGLSHDMTIDNCSFVDNNAGNSGAGIYIAAENVSITNSSFTSNICSEFGGGVQILDSFTDNVVTIGNCLFDNNEATYGGGMYFQTVGTNALCTISSSTFSNNTAASTTVGAYGGGLEMMFADNNEGTANEGATIIEDCQFINNTSTGNGGGVSLINGSTGSGNSYMVRNCHIEGNSAVYNAGGLLGYQTSDSDLSMTVSHSTFVNNNSSYALAMGFVSLASLNAIMNVDNCSFDEHSGFNPIATIINQNVSAEFTNCTINGSAPGIAGIEVTDIKLRNNIINTSEFSSVLSLDTETENQFTSLGGNLFSDAAASAWALAEDQQNANPAFEVGTLQLSQSSPAVDAGILSDDVADFDLAGNDRIQGSCIDIGAYESSHDAGTTCLSVSVKEEIVSSSAMEVFPNPATDVVNISLENDWKGTLSLRIVNILGQTVQSISIEKDSEFASWNLDANQFAKGTYKILLSNGTQVAVKTLVVIR